MIGFAGAPWTLASYMIEGGSSKDYQKTRLFAYKNPEKFDMLITLLTSAICHFLKKQFHAGVNIVKVFDSWANYAPPLLTKKAIIEPFKKINYSLDGKKMIAFPRGIGININQFIQETEIKIIALDQFQDIENVHHYVANKNMIYQGNLDPFLLKAGGSMMEKAIENLLLYNETKHILNLGHGIDKETPIENVEKLCEMVKKYYGMD